MKPGGRRAGEVERQSIGGTYLPRAEKATIEQTGKMSGDLRPLRSQHFEPGERGVGRALPRLAPSARSCRSKG